MNKQEMVIWLFKLAAEIDAAAIEEYNRMFGSVDKANSLSGTAHGIRESAKYVERYLDECP